MVELLLIGEYAKKEKTELTQKAQSSQMKGDKICDGDVNALQ